MDLYFLLQTRTENLFIKVLVRIMTLTILEQTIGMTRIVFQGITVGLICFQAEQLSKQITGVDPKFKSPKQNNFSTELNALGYGAIR